MQEPDPPRQTYSPAEAAADEAFYAHFRRKAVVGALPAALVPAAVLAVWQPWFGAALAVGGIAGAANAGLSIYGNEKLLERRSVAAFVLSSFVRIGLFGIVPVVLAVEKPSLWTLGCYFIGFFMPLVLSGILVHLRERR